MFEGTTLLEKLPAVRGKLKANAPLGHITWFRVGGNAEVLFRPADKEDLIQFIKECPKDIPIMVIGVASNMIIRDGGIPGVVIRLGKGFNEIDVVENHQLKVGVAALDLNVALTAQKHSVGGLEFFSGIPGSIGGALRMNAGAYGGETKDVLVTAEVLFRDGTVKNMTADEMGMSYRHSDVPKDAIFLSATFQGNAGDPVEIKGKIREIKEKREGSQPIREKTGGSTFANPEGNSSWKLVDAAGMRGFKLGGAQMSEKHANFMINTGDATAADLERLGEEVRKRVYEQSGIMLRWEIRRVGVPLDGDTDIQAFIEKG